MSSGQVPATKLPAAYPDLPYREIKISHHPASSKEVTPVLICTLYRPKQNNAFTDVMTDEIEHFFALASIDDRVKVIVVTGEGRMFCAGQDLNQGQYERQAIPAIPSMLRNSVVLTIISL